MLCAVPCEYKDQDSSPQPQTAMARVHILALLVPAPFLASSQPRYNSPKQDQNFPDFGQYYHMNIIPEEDAVPDWINPWRFHSPRAVGVTAL